MATSNQASEPIENEGMIFLPLSTIGVICMIALFKFDLLIEIKDYILHLIKTDPMFVLGISGLVILSIGLAIAGKYYYAWYLKSQKEKAEHERILEIEKNVLIKIYKTMNGVNWNKNKGWLSNEPIFKWKGVHINHKTGRISKLILANNKLTGQIPPEIGELSHIDELDMRENEICGSIPNGLVQLKRLQGCYLFNNQLSGHIPVDEFAKMKSLQGLYLMNNNFEEVEHAREKLQSALPNAILYI